LESLISNDPAVGRELAKFELMQIWTYDSKIRPLDREQKERMEKQFGTTAIPLHVIVAPDGAELERYVYSPGASAETYAAFLGRGLAKYARRSER
jgi:hypothetical protein